jgi:hypothetical protein
MFRGYISTQRTCWCGQCGKWVQVDIGNYYKAVAEFRRLGWRWTKKHGWLCLPCRKGQNDGG